MCYTEFVELLTKKEKKEKEGKNPETAAAGQRFRKERGSDDEKRCRMVAGGFSGDYAGAALDGGYIHQRRWWNGGLFSSVLCSQPRIFSGGRNFRRQRRQASVESAGDIGGAVSVRHMALLCSGRKRVPFVRGGLSRSRDGGVCPLPCAEIKAMASVNGRGLRRCRHGMEETWADRTKDLRKRAACSAEIAVKRIVTVRAFSGKNDKHQGLYYT